MEKIELVLTARDRDLGGFSVHRILPCASHPMVGPFIFFDHMGPADFPSGHGIDVRPHPHINLATVTYLFEGKINLKDFYRIIDVNEDSFEIRKGEAETLAGFILEIIGNFPKKGQKIHFENCLFTIEVVDNKRVKQIKVTIDE